MASAKMKPPLIGFKILLTLFFNLVSVVYAQLNLGQGIQREVFFLNLEDGFFGCQVNESTQVLQLFELSRLCDGIPNCFLASDENIQELKCTNTCPYTKGHSCINGACLDGQCHCNDGYGGCGCEDLDENECKYRPCDVFATCTNTLGSFFCTCYPGYEGDGQACKDIDECQDPKIAAQCVDNAWCCNLPSHYTCKCNEGYTGDGYSLCTDINECSNPNACGSNAICSNLPGNYTCSCPEGFVGNPYDGCADLDECQRSDACGPSAKCSNREGGHQCECPLGSVGDPYSRAGCVDINECVKSPCAKGALCVNGINNYTCACPPGFFGDSYNPLGECRDVNECLSNPCGTNAKCIDNIGSYGCQCLEGFVGDPYTGCKDMDECSSYSRPCGLNAICTNKIPGFDCTCPQGFIPRPTAEVACEQTDVTVPCKSNYNCVNNAICRNGQCFCRDGFKAVGATCTDIDECSLSPCGPDANCRNIPGSFQCNCNFGFIGNPPEVECKAPCEGVKCGPHATCQHEGEAAVCKCNEGWSYNPGDISQQCVDVNECEAGNRPSGLCATGSICTNTPGSFTCQCPLGFTGNPLVSCLDVDECRRPGACGHGAVCKNTPGSFTCECPLGTMPEPDAYTECLEIMTCDSDDECPGNALCLAKQCMCPEPNIGDDCRHPCEDIQCGQNAECKLINGHAKCLCENGFDGNPTSIQGCSDINECNNNPCGKGAVCKNEPGHFTCECPSGFEGNPGRDGCVEVKSPGCGPSSPCPSGEQCIKDPVVRENVCVCQRGYVRDEKSGECRDINECIELRGRPACGLNAICKNLPGSYDCQCPRDFVGNPFNGCQKCNSIACRCQPPYRIVGGKCVLANCSSGKICPPGAECVKIQGGVSYCACPKGFTTLEDGTCQDINECTERKPDGSLPCGLNAQCFNEIGKYECACPPGTSGDPYRTGCSVDKVQCSSDGDCRENEHCIQPGKCVCAPPFYVDMHDNNRCKSPCESFSCGLSSKCIPSNPPKCICLPGFTSTGFNGCVDIDECKTNPCGKGAICINEIGTYKCECGLGMSGDPNGSGCQHFDDTPVTCSSDNECSNELKCNDQGMCVSPCEDLPCGKNAYCEAASHARFCRCVPGYVEGPNGECVSMCDGFLCGENAKCIVANEGPTCKCDEGDIGNPFPGGSCSPDVCSVANPCVEPQICVNGRCKERCEGVICGVGAKCDKTSNKCICLPDFLGDPNLLCVPPVTPPLCTPACGSNSHCEYGQPNRCICNGGFSGNPYQSCTSQLDKADCLTTKCGTNAQCRQGISRVDCVCPVGYRGNPYVGCEDVDECIGNACGMNAVCLNTAGSYDCRCQEGFSGNPFMMCMPIESSTDPCDLNPHLCGCARSSDCSPGLLCENGKCVDPCANVVCGKNAACNRGTCVCLPGFKGSPSEPEIGCSSADCKNNLDCKNNEICFSSRGTRKCVDACQKVQCGPNAICVAQNHRSSCLCKDGFVPIPNDKSGGCQIEDRESKCETTNDCQQGFICQIDSSGQKGCVDPCLNLVCGQNELCFIDKGTALCKCAEGFIRNPASNSCEKPGVPDCLTDSDCSERSACVADNLGVLKCVEVCKDFTCGLHSFCVGINHRGQCQCEDGFTGNPNDRSGCRPIPQDECSTDSQCPETHVCKQVNNKKKCNWACDLTKCGPGAVCVPKNHATQCQCPPGLFAGDPYDLVNGCKSVSCLINEDCSFDQACDRMSFKCFDVCHDACGDNAVCIPENHRYNCKCPPGSTPNPSAEIQCSTVDVCSQNPCHPTAKCIVSGGSHKCECQTGMVGDPYAAGCHPEGTCPNGDKDCPSDSVCKNGRCSSPCERACGANSLCNVVNRTPVCSCPPGFKPQGTAQNGCNRGTTSCSNDAQCNGGVCNENTCQIVCRNNRGCAENEKCIENMCKVPCVSSNQCSKDQACISGVCKVGCTSSLECSEDKACVENKCINPCEKLGVCGPNAKCQPSDHKAVCECPVGFKATLTAQQGCIRIPTSCDSNDDCPEDTKCDDGACMAPCTRDDHCAQGERCTEGKCMKVCFNNGNCLQGEVCIDSSCVSGCSTKQDCSANEVCVSKKCWCSKGYSTGPNGCVDIDECTDNPCDSTAECINVPGSFQCSCPSGTVRDKTGTACVPPNECERDDDCPGEQACKTNGNGQFKCIDPCASALCGKNSICSVEDRKPVCECQPGHFGDPNNLSVGCVQGECVHDEDCNSNRMCDRQNFKCVDPCNTIDCRYGRCQTINHKPTCQCEKGFQIDSSTGTCIDINECLQNPCHRTSECRNTVGSYTCACPANFVGDPYTTGCRSSGTCITPNHCPMSAACIQGKCKNPCETASCGIKSKCRVVSHQPFCFCPPLTTGNPTVECSPIECDDQISFCKPGFTCIDNSCINICDIPGTCGKNTECNFKGTQQTCSCKPGFTGDPNLGCTEVRSCTSDRQCPSGEQCNGGLCVSVCTSNRECLQGQVCISGSCSPTCRSNNECPDLQICQNNLCVPEMKCLKDADCNDSEQCQRNSVGQADCKNVCDGLVLCGRNAQCTSINHKAVCQCPEDYHGDPMDEKVGCQPIQCKEPNDCESTEVCENYRCKMACKINNNCGQNALCVSENHKAVCFCRNGYDGDPLKGCESIDFCKSNPCADKGTNCINSLGSYRCMCDYGKVGDPYKVGCETPGECTNDNGCQLFAYCDLEARECKDACGQKTCGANAQCEPVNHKAICRCRSGYEGDADKGCRPEVVSCQLNSDCPPNTICDGGLCRPPCQSDDECGLNESCLKGQCNNLCDEDSACGLNSICNMINHEKRCSCPEGFTGDSEIECYRLPEACRQNSDCDSGFSCESGVCTPTCSSDKACALNEKCIDAMCLLTCRVDNDCFLGHICINNMCTIGCRISEDCTATESCVNSKCTDVCKSGAVCGPNSKCIVVNHRARCSCPSGFIPNPTPNIACVREPVSCSVNSDCGSGFVCDSGSCTPICSTSDNCLGNEQCDGYLCRPVCSRDDDCRSGEICSNAMCVVGCRDNSECPSNQACVNRKCSSPCDSPTACGINAQCSVKNHKSECECANNMVGDPYINCRQPPTSCNDDEKCSGDMSCIGGVCKPKCTSDRACLGNERCIGGTCKEICNSDTQCGPGNICMGRVCIAGCRSDNTCPSEHACINRKCTDPCKDSKVCGECAVCKVVNHRSQCSCPSSTIGNAAVLCSVPHRSCSENSNCQPNESCEGGYCLLNCGGNDKCKCGEKCYKNLCRPECDLRKKCNQGFLCERGACVAGCRTNSDCPSSTECINDKCKNPCDSNPCGDNAECRSSDHRPLCICRNGYHGDAYIKCIEFECQKDDECSLDKACIQKECKDPCLLGTCGLNALCKVVQHKSECSCPTNYYGNPTIACKEDQNECLTNPCGENAQCTNTVGSYECKCNTGCTGNAKEAGCICTQDQIDPCARLTCGANAECREISFDDAECYCPSTFPVGDPNIKCFKDCRQTGCGLGADCVPGKSNSRECVCKNGWNGNPYVECVPDTQCTLDTDCQPSKACLGGQCSDPCTLRGACGENALCQVKNHQVSCKCLQCYNGNPKIKCDPDPLCPASQKTTPTPLTGVKCKLDSDCESFEACKSGQCHDPCSLSTTYCESNKRCEVRQHRPICICKFGFTVNSAGEFVCAGRRIECRESVECSSNLACIENKCVNPCAVQKPCPPKKECSVVNHQPVCICEEGCHPSVTICLNDKGCPSSQACLHYQCTNPCESHVCPGDSPCYVEDHQPLCKFCPPGYTVEENLGCVPAIGCRDNSDCPPKQACINKQCQNPCVAQNPCSVNEDCKVEGQDATCIAVGCRANSDCLSTQACINKQCKSPCDHDDPCEDPEECEVRDHVAFCISACTCGFDSECSQGYSCDGCTCRPIAIPQITCNPSCRPDEKCDPDRLVCVPIKTVKPGCKNNNDCSSILVCDAQTQSCVDPCLSKPCAALARCHVVLHTIKCECPFGHSGNPYIECLPPHDEPEDCPGGCPPNLACIDRECKDPCNCGRNAICEVFNNRATCRCPPNYTGNALTNCRKVTVDNPCDLDPCGIGAICELDNGNPICSCPKGTTGNPFDECILEGDECDDDQCGPNSGCRIVSGSVHCFCLPEYVGNPPSQLCKKPETSCEPSPCGENTNCHIVNGFHRCTCKPGYIGNPNTIRGCDVPLNLCDGNTCGEGAICNPSGSPLCSCRPGLVGNPLKSCKVPAPTCQLGSCGLNAECYEEDNKIKCRCYDEYDGNPYVRCTAKPDNPCEPNPCGTNTQCRVSGNKAACTCLPLFFGDPYSSDGCKPECTSNKDCLLSEACFNTQCKDPCVGACGIKAECKVESHRPTCTCPAGHLGNPYTECRKPEVHEEPVSEPPAEKEISPCTPSPCGPGAECRVQGERPVCKCFPDYIGDPYISCRPECITNGDCNDDKACIRSKCQDPCPGSCGLNAECEIDNHNPICYCPKEYTGDPFIRCIKHVEEEPVNTCNPSPCGPNSHCSLTSNGRNYVCQCLPGYFGTPCRPECTISSDCPSNKACQILKCIDPCPGSCGINSDCSVVKHNPICRCRDGYTGDPFTLCYIKPTIDKEAEVTPRPTVSPCVPSCGNNAECETVSSVSQCVCKSGYYPQSDGRCGPQCTTNSQCSFDKACLNKLCIDPCRGACGSKTTCAVQNHRPICSCQSGFKGDPYTVCDPIGEIKPTPAPPTAITPCYPNPCGINAQCSPVGTFGLCSCLPGYKGDPTVQCGPECTTSSDCPSTQACKSDKCKDPCPGACGSGAQCVVVSHNAICSCPTDYIGNPFTGCQQKPAEPVATSPCDKCGPNAECRNQGDNVVCKCSAGTFGDPYGVLGCRPECITNTDCRPTLTCITNKCVDPCKENVCGVNAECHVVSHNPRCHCPPGYTGNSLRRCFIEPITERPVPTSRPPIAVDEEESCDNHDCGENAHCLEENGIPVCKCSSGYFGNPDFGCRPECVIDQDCSSSKACYGGKCLDPCPGICGSNAECYVNNYKPVCACKPSYTGDPYTGCHFQQPLPPDVKEQTTNPCSPDPCGPNSKCEINTNRPVCSCLPGYYGEPPRCRPECTVNPECPRNKACIKNKCNDPCRGTCGTNALCEVVNHNPICYCPKDMTGDPFESCIKAISTTSKPISPCAGDYCGPNAKCRDVNGKAVCTCLPDYIGRPPQCRPECTVHTECPPYLACVNKKCRDPCAGLCGVNAECIVMNHNPTCSCTPNYSGDPYTRCVVVHSPPITEAYPPSPPPTPSSPKPPITEISKPPHPPIVPQTDGSRTTLPPIAVTPPPTVEDEPELCSLDPCGSNTICIDQFSSYVCQCKPGYFGDPNIGCGPECVLNTDCGQRQTCVNQKCISACPGRCAPTAQCNVVNHQSRCSCPPGYTGDAYKRCYIQPIISSTTPEPLTPVTEAPCERSPCGKNAECIPKGSYADCRCLPGYFGNPFEECKPECTLNSHCPFYLACVKEKCIDPCPSACGINADCQVVMHSPVCTCRHGFTGDPYDACSRTPSTTTPQPNVCEPSPCGPNSKCKEQNGRPICECLPGYFGRPPNCRPECVENYECISTLACIKRKCQDPCPGVCGADALCEVDDHNPICFCPSDMTGDPFVECKPFPSTTESPQKDVCDCGDNAECLQDGNRNYCKCLPDFYGNPYDRCEPECVINSGCPKYLACENQKCVDPCPGTCGVKAVCDVYNHKPVCDCPKGMTGDPLKECIFPAREPEHLCNPNPCGSYTECDVKNNRVVCSCLPGYPGTPETSCNPECTTNSDCPLSSSCINRLCVDPCAGACHPTAECRVVSHHPRCTCPEGYTGNPTAGCYVQPEVERDPCKACGKSAECIQDDDKVICKCPPNYYGNPYVACKPECIINQDCPNYLSCQKEKCKDPCPDKCGINALCDVVTHSPVCSCPQNYEGDPYIECRELQEEVPEPECRLSSQCSDKLACIEKKCQNPCALYDTCAPNAECNVFNHHPVCSCPDGYTGNPSMQCFVVGCRDNSECPVLQACINKKCEDPCLYEQCGVNALCKVVSQRAQCYCPERFQGDPYVQCTRPECVVDGDCPSYLACIKEKCQDPCNCPEGSICRVYNHRPQCTCPAGYTGDANMKCFTVEEKTTKECYTDGDCPSKMACFDNECESPCQILKPCAKNAYCEVLDTLPYRSMTCVCPPGYHGNAFEECLLAPEEPIGCKSDAECGLSELCRNRICIDPCALLNPCAANAECIVKRKQATCTCPPGHTGDPRSNCYTIVEDEPECRTDSDCATDKACYKEHCNDPCIVEDPCGREAICKVNNHRPYCSCPDGWFGDPTFRCYKAECTIDEDCPTDKACRNEKCVNPCSYDGHRCGIGADCRAALHQAQCYCPTGTQGNPLKACVTVGCESNDDCSDDKVCDRINFVCVPVCELDTCAKEAECRGINHAAMCTCPPRFFGNPFVHCAEEKELPGPPLPEPECRSDSECPSMQACFNEICRNPCALESPCIPSQKCRVVDTLPLRTLVCECPPDQILFTDGVCVRPIAAVPQCVVDEDCASHEKCREGTCHNVCLPGPCGRNAICTGSDHKAECKCAPGFQGDPYETCSRAPPVVQMPLPECEADKQCSDQQSCVNKHCVNPCMINDPCARDAFCYVNLHRPVCRCPEGYTGVPEDECKPIELPISIGCRADSECANNRACINTKCVIPCDCGPNAECTIDNHRPTCTCLEGYQGDPKSGCYKAGCQKNEECPTDTMCYKGVCINPCYINDPCAVNAECYAELHESKCRCPSGMQGDPHTLCELIGCKANSECPTDKACVNRQCIDPCLYENMCAPNAQCYVNQHITGCKCPPERPYGDPRFMCEESPPEVHDEPECRYDGDCPSQRACINQTCVNPCHVLDPCDATAKCKVVDSLPVRTMICICIEGYIMGENDVCQIIPLDITPQCRSDSECGVEKACINRMCKDPCRCGSNAECDVTNHRSVCTCQVGFQGNPDINCFPVGCAVNNDCEDDKACYEGVCANPCLVDNPCASNAECYAEQHQAKCRCPSGLQGDGYTQCLIIGCRANSNCPPDRACINNQCKDPCMENPCSPTSECLALNNQAMCRCPPGTYGNPQVRCEPLPEVECYQDADCPSQHACLNSVCANPCEKLEPCDDTAICKVIDTLPLRTMLCACPDGMVIKENGKCEILPPIRPICTAHEECPSDEACVNGFCKYPCQCGANADCDIVDHHAVCTCKPGFEGIPEISCREIGCYGNDDCATTHACIKANCTPVCGPDNEPCGKEAICQGINHQPQCLCPPGLRGNPNTQCIAIGCASNDNCPDNLACENERCEDPCGLNPCIDPAACKVDNHIATCPCPPGFNGTFDKGCERIIIGCRADSECPPELACINRKCTDLCSLNPCGENAKCRTVDTLPLRMAACECLPGYQGDASEICYPVKACPIDKGYITNEEGECECPIDKNFYVDENGNCRLCPVEKGFVMTSDGTCICDPSKGYVITRTGECDCPLPLNRADDGSCVLLDVTPLPPICAVNDDCPQDRMCENQNCVRPCGFDPCSKHAVCINANHTAVCYCISSYAGDPYKDDGCKPTTFGRTDFPRPTIVVNCLADGVQVNINIGEPGFDGLMYVKGYSKNEECRKILREGIDVSTIDFKVKFNTCGLIHENGLARFVLVIQKHPKLVTFDTQAYHVKCTYSTGEKTITIGFNVSMLTTAGTIANTGPPPVCLMKITNQRGGDISQAEIGDLLLLNIIVEPSDIYGGFARSCVALTSDEDGENRYMVTDENGCATDPNIFQEWSRNSNKSLIAPFSAFKFPSSNSIRFECNVRVCFGNCQPVNCNGYDAYGKRRRRQAIDPDAEYIYENEATYEGQMREIQVSSQSILTVERRSERLTAGEDFQGQIDEVCVSKWGFIIALIITALLALVAVAVAVSCWLMAYRRRPKHGGPLPHPEHFPNPLFTTPDPLAEPSPDYVS